MSQQPQSLEDHPIASIFPLLNDEELSELSADIRERGVLLPILLYEGKILDGRNRYRAARMAGAHFVTNHYVGDSPAGEVISLNLRRRQLTPSQRAAAAVEALPHFEAEAKTRERMGKERIPDPDKGQARDKAAEATGANPRYVQDAKTIKEHAPDVFEKVRAGEVSIPEAKRELAKVNLPQAPLPPVRISEGMRLWTLAKAHLDKIARSDEERERALKAASKYINHRLASNQ